MTGWRRCRGAVSKLGRCRSCRGTRPRRSRSRARRATSATLRGSVRSSGAASSRSPFSTATASSSRRAREPVSRVEVDGGETLLLFDPRPLEAYEELRVGFTAAVSHELRTPLARLLVLIESSVRPDADIPALLERARAEVEQMRELVDDL